MAGGGFSVRVVGGTALIEQLRLMRDKAPILLAAGMLEGAETIATKAKEICPVDTGTLRSTIHAKPPKIEGERVTCSIDCGGPAAPYAVYVHERLNAYHRPPTQAKFLERPALEEKANITATIEARVRAILEGGR